MPGIRGLRIAIVDEGRLFDPIRDSSKPSLDADLKERPIGGLGIHLVREFADEMKYDQRDLRNHPTLMKQRSKQFFGSKGPDSGRPGRLNPVRAGTVSLLWCLVTA